MLMFLTVLAIMACTASTVCIIGLMADTIEVNLHDWFVGASLVLAVAVALIAANLFITTIL